MNDSPRAGEREEGQAPSEGTAEAARDRAGTGTDRHSEIDWVAAERSPEFRALIKKRRSFVLPATIFFLSWYFGFIILAGYAEDFMGESVYEGLTVGYVLALSQFVMTWTLGWLYLRKADRDFDPLARKAAQTALEAGRAGGSPPSGGRRDEMTGGSSGRGEGTPR